MDGIENLKTNAIELIKRYKYLEIEKARLATQVDHLEQEMVKVLQQLDVFRQENKRLRSLNALLGDVRSRNELRNHFKSIEQRLDHCLSLLRL